MNFGPENSQKMAIKSHVASIDQGPKENPGEVFNPYPNIIIIARKWPKYPDHYYYYFQIITKCINHLNANLQEVKPKKDPPKLKILENYALMGTRNSNVVNKAVSKFMELSAEEVLILSCDRLHKEANFLDHTNYLKEKL